MWTNDGEWDPFPLPKMEEMISGMEWSPQNPVNMGHGDGETGSLGDTQSAQQLYDQNSNFYQESQLGSNEGEVGRESDYIATQNLAMRLSDDGYQQRMPDCGDGGAASGSSPQKPKPQKTPKTGRKYGTGLEALRSRPFKNNNYKNDPYCKILIDLWGGKVTMKGCLRPLIRLLESEGRTIKNKRLAMRLKAEAVRVLKSHIPIDKIGEYVMRVRSQ